MKYNGIYEVDPSFLNGGKIVWQPTGNGEYVIATKEGKKYFVKRNMHARYPTKGVSKSVYDKLKAQATALQNKQKQLHNLMKDLNWQTDHVVVEEENFWDSGKMFTTITPCVPDVLPDKFDYTTLSFDEFVQLAKSAAAALNKLHNCGVIHGDLKGANILVSNKDGKYVAYLIDFDSSYPTDAIPTWTDIGGSEGYQSPEVLIYGLEEDSAPPETITTKTDIFSLGVAFHKWWAGAFPEVDLEHCAVGAAVYYDKRVTIDKKFDTRIGEKFGISLKSLINWMLAKNPADRPTAQQVFDVLCDNLAVPEEFLSGKDDGPFDNELWESHKSIAKLLSVAELKRKGVKSLKRVNDGGGTIGLKYRLIKKSGTEKLTLTQLCDKGYAVWQDALLDSPWEEHQIEFESADTFARKGFTKISRETMGFQKRYLMIAADGTQIDHESKWLIENGLAHTKSISIDADTPWPEHGKKYCFGNMATLGMKSISRVEVGGEHRYKIVYNEIVDGKNKVNEQVPANNLKLMGIIK